MNESPQNWNVLNEAKNPDTSGEHMSAFMTVLQNNASFFQEEIIFYTRKLEIERKI